MLDGAALAAIGAALESSARRSTARKTGDGATLGASYYSPTGASYYK
ncbi:hypothetical protein [Polyangium mundeleinium]|uniref:Uncharacterized protein n=1 Tax=Polyangium mundeleinium TaxID=2995306 RepID=A0ABT5EVW6_9BACT|nr:hypothetical protein [Polyangium mundeleinium]MDC0745338.1 hypothetical protein [Polyangium mundeleinium]